MSEMKIKFPFEIRSVEPEVNQELLQYFHGEKTGFVQVGPEKYFFPNKYRAESEAYYNFQARPDDIWVASFPRSGTTWTQELVWLIANDLDFDSAKSRLLPERFPFFEFPLFLHPEVKDQLIKENANNEANLQFIEEIDRPGYELLTNLPQTQRRFIKTHFPFSLLPPSVLQKGCKIIYVARDPKDVAVSYYHLNRLYRTQGYVGDFERYWGYFERGLNPWMPYYSHIREALKHKQLSNVLYLQYEDMLSNLRETTTKVARFLECEIRPERMEDLLNHLNISNFRLNPSVNGSDMAAIGMLSESKNSFVRKGKSGSFQSEFSEVPGLLERANEWVKRNEIEIMKEF